MIMSKEINSSILELYFQTVDLINARSKVARDYGTPHKIYRAEIHTLQAMVDYPEANASTLAELLSVTNGALTQVVSKLVKKGLIKSYTRSGNKKEVFFSPTELGLLADRNHRIYDEKLFKEKFGFLYRMTREEQETVLNFFAEVKRGLTE